MYTHTDKYSLTLYLLSEVQIFCQKRDMLKTELLDLLSEMQIFCQKRDMLKTQLTDSGVFQGGSSCFLRLKH